MEIRTRAICMLLGVIILSAFGCTKQHPEVKDRMPKGCDLDYVDMADGFNRDGKPYPDYSDAELSHQRERASKLRLDLETASLNKVKSFTVEPGEYRFANNQGLILSGYSDMHIACKDVTFWFERENEDLLADPKGLIMRNCSDVVIEGLTVDFYPSLYVQGSIVDVNSDEAYVDLKVQEGYPYADGFTGQALLYKSNGEIVPQGVYYNNRTEKIGDGILRTYLNTGDFVNGNTHPELLSAFGERVTVRNGDYIALTFRRGSGISLTYCSYCEILSVNIYFAPGMGIYESFGTANVYDGVRIIRRPGTNRVLACMADCFHSNCGIVGPTVRNCEFAYNCDDFINLHGYFAVATKKISPCEFVIVTLLGEPLEAGGTLDFYDFESMEHGGSAVILHVETDGNQLIPAEKLVKDTMGVLWYPYARAYNVLLDRSVDADATALVEINSYNQSGFLIENNYMHDSMGRAMLLSGAHDGIVRNNTWRRFNGGVYVYMESCYTMEGQFPRNICIEGNRFEDILSYVPVRLEFGSPQQGFISVTYVPGTNYLRQSINIYDISIVGNYIENPPYIPILITYTEGVLVKDNIVNMPYFVRNYLDTPTYDAFYSEDPDCLVYLNTVRNIEVYGNKTADETIREYTVRNLRP